MPGASSAFPAVRADLRVISNKIGTVPRPGHHLNCLFHFLRPSSDFSPRSLLLSLEPYVLDNRAWPFSHLIPEGYMTEPIYAAEPPALSCMDELVELAPWDS